MSVRDAMYRGGLSYLDKNIKRDSRDFACLCEYYHRVDALARARYDSW